MADEITGYLHSSYAKSLSEFGVPRLLPECQGWLLQRRIAGSESQDAMGCYPIFCCRHWSRLHADLQDLSGDLVSVTMVTDPFGEYDEASLRRSFRDTVVRFKEHFIADLGQPLDSFVQDHHQRNARKALQELQVEKCAEPARFLAEWNGLYSNLVTRHNICGLTAFSPASFEGQLSVPGLVAFRAEHEGRGVGMLLWYVQDDVAYYHLGAYSDEGYELRASFALFWTAMQYFADEGMPWLNLGAGAGTSGNDMDGLSRFKRGWATGTRTAYLCGRIFKPTLYAEIMHARGMFETRYFPAYRAGEFV